MINLFILDHKSSTRNVRSWSKAQKT